MNRYFILIVTTVLFFPIIACIPPRVVFDVEKKPLIDIKADDTILIVPFGFRNISLAKDFYSEGSSEFSNEMHKRLTSDNHINVIDIDDSMEIYKKHISKDISQGANILLDLSPDNLEKISKLYNTQFIIIGDIEFNTLDASSYDRIEEYDPRIGRYRSYNMWVRRRRFVINLHYKIYSDYEKDFIKDKTEEKDIVVEDYQQQVYGFWLLMPSMIDDIAEMFISKKIEASKFILR